MKPKQLPNTVEICSVGQVSGSIKPGDFFLVRGNNTFSQIIQFGQALRFRKNKQYTYWTHAGIFTSANGDIIEADGRGIVENNISYYKDMKYAIVHIQATDQDRQEVVDFARTTLGEQYGWATILSIGISALTGLHFSFGFPAQAICSGLVTRALERTTYIPTRDPESATPADLAMDFNVVS